MTYKWFIASVVSGQEQSVSDDINRIIEKEGEACKIKEALVPTKPVIKVRRGKKVEDKQKLFPGYVFINMVANGDVFTRLRNSTKVLGFLGPKNNPKPVTDLKVQKIIEEASSVAEKTNSLDVFDIGESVKIIKGPFESFTGVIEEKDLNKNRVKLSVSIFGRATSVDLEVSQIEKVE